MKNLIFYFAAIICFFTERIHASVHGIEMQTQVNGRPTVVQRTQGIHLVVNGQNYIVTTSQLRTSETASYFIDANRAQKAQLVAHDFQRGLVLLSLNQGLHISPSFDSNSAISFDFNSRMNKSFVASVYSQNSIRHPFLEIENMIEAQIATSNINELAGAALTDENRQVYAMISSYALEFSLGGVYKLKPLESFQLNKPHGILAYPIATLSQWIEDIQKNKLIIPEIEFVSKGQVKMRWSGLELGQKCSERNISNPPLGGNDGAGIGGGRGKVKFLDLLDTQFSKDAPVCEFTFYRTDFSPTSRNLPSWMIQVIKMLDNYNEVQVSYFLKNLGSGHFVGGEIKDLRNLFFIAGHSQNFELVYFPTVKSIFQNLKEIEYIRAGYDNWWYKLNLPFSTIDELELGKNSKHAEFFYGQLLSASLLFDSEPHELFKSNFFRAIDISSIEEMLSGPMDGPKSYYRNLKLQIELYPFIKQRGSL